ncbi:hypothetical protein DMUE_5160 [Dictyocoela muelleri]|nr:hypothetical protein DMUE_5160 [Dictyocoela muelleri]
MRLLNTKDNKINYTWKCFFNGCSQYKTTISIFKNSFFSESKIESRSVIKVLYYLSLGELITSITEFTQIDKKKCLQNQVEINDLYQLILLLNPIRLVGLGYQV